MLKVKENLNFLLTSTSLIVMLYTVVTKKWETL